MNDLLKGFLWTAGAVAAVALAGVARRRLSAATPAAQTADAAADSSLMTADIWSISDIERVSYDPGHVLGNPLPAHVTLPDWFPDLGIYPLPDRETASINDGPPEGATMREVADWWAERWQRVSFGINPPRSGGGGVSYSGAGSSSGYTAPSGGATATGWAAGSRPSGSSGWVMS